MQECPARYVALVVINPFIGGMCLSYVWGPLALHWKANNWPAWHLGALSMLAPLLSMTVWGVVFVLVELLLDGLLAQGPCGVT